MNNALVIAKHFISLGIKDGMPVSPMKLQKIVYFSYGWYWAYYDKKLFDEDIQAWNYGPVIESVYHKYKFYGQSPIMDVDGRFVDNFINKINAEKKSFLDQMWKLYRSYSGVQLANATHMEGTPWFTTKQKYPRERGIVIKDSVIKDYFVALKNKAN